MVGYLTVVLVHVFVVGVVVHVRGSGSRASSSSGRYASQWAVVAIAAVVGSRRKSRINDVALRSGSSRIAADSN